MIKTILVDDSVVCLETLQSMCEQTGKLEICAIFLNPLEALDYADENMVDCAFLDIEMPELNGLELGLKLREKYPHMVLIFVTCKEEYCVSAIKMKADFYIFKPYSQKDIEDAVERAGLLIRRKEQYLKVVMLGRFNLFVNDKAVYFANAKAKELFALCLDHRGGVVSMEEAIDKLWPDKAYDDRVKRLYRKAIGSLKNTLLQCTKKPVFTNKRASCQILPEYFECDYYTLLDGKESRTDFENQIDHYLEEYSWSEEVISGYLMNWKE